VIAVTSGAGNVRGVAELAQPSELFITPKIANAAYSATLTTKGFVAVISIGHVTPVTVQSTIKRHASSGEVRLWSQLKPSTQSA
jgi:hypothetical protein